MEDMRFIHLNLVMRVKKSISVIPGCFDWSRIDDPNSLVLCPENNCLTDKMHEPFHTLDAETILHKMVERCRIGQLIPCFSLLCTKVETILLCQETNCPDIGLFPETLDDKS